MEKNISINGQTMEGQHLKDQQGLYQLSPSNEYSVGQEYNFSVHAAKGHLTEFTDHEKMKNLVPVEASAAITETEAIAAASAFLGEIVDVSEYTITCENRETYYLVYFIKYFNGVESIDKAFTYVSMTGEVVHYYAFSLGELSSELTLNISVTDADAATLAKVEELYYDQLVQHHYAEITIYGKRVILAENGTLALLYDVEIIAREQLSGDAFLRHETRAQFVICENDTAE